jgi:hypothetical protein
VSASSRSQPGLIDTTVTEALLADPGPLPSSAVAEARGALEQAAREVGLDPLGSLTKAVVSDLVACGRFGLASLRRELEEPPSSSALALGSVVELGVRSWFAYQASTGRGDGPQLWLEAYRLEADAVELEEDQVAEAEARRNRIVRELVIPAHWWPRTEVRARVDLGSGAQLRGRFDLVIGGPPTRHPLHLVEIKSSVPLNPDQDDDVWFYAVLGVLRYAARPPASILLLGPGVEGAQVRQLLIDEAVLEHAVARVRDALDEAGAAASGRPRERVGPRCQWCPFRDACETWSRAR